jgi:hypothetical protein
VNLADIKVDCLVFDLAARMGKAFVHKKCKLHDTKGHKE